MWAALFTPGRGGLEKDTRQISSGFWYVLPVTGVLEEESLNISGPISLSVHEGDWTGSSGSPPVRTQ